MHNSDEKTLDLKDYLVELLFRWKSVLIITAIVAVLLTGAGILRSRSGSTMLEEPGQELSVQDIEEHKKLLVEETRIVLTDLEAQDVERVFRQYQSYIEYRNLYQEELESFDQAFDRSGDEMLIKSVSYSVEAPVEGVDTLFSSSAMDIEDYQKITEILPDSKSLQSAYKRVFFSVVRGSSTALTNFGEDTAIMPNRYMITVEIVGENREVCEGIWEIVDAAMLREQKELRKISPDVKVETVGSNYRGNIYKFYISKKQDTVDSIQKVDTIISNLKQSSIDKFSEEQTAYFNALRNPERGLIENGVYSIAELEGNDTADTGSGSVGTLLKFGILGIAAGLFLSFFYVLLRYLFSGMINAGQEMQNYYRVPLLGTFFIRGARGTGLFPGLIRKLLRVDSTEAETKAAMIAADICGAVQLSEDDSVYIAQTCDAVEDVRIANMMEQAVRVHSPQYSVSTGLPLGSVEEMQALMQEKNVFLLIHNKKTSQADVEKILDLCSRQQIRVPGTVAITDI